MENQGLASMLGLSNNQDTLMSNGQKDDIPANNEKGDMPIQISEGEFVFSVPSIIGLGEGDYNKGLTILETLHNNLKAKGRSLVENKGVGAIKE